MQQEIESERARRLAHVERCRVLGIRPVWDREFRYYPGTDADTLRENRRLARTHPRAAFEHARDDDAFQRWLETLLRAVS